MLKKIVNDIEKKKSFTKKLNLEWNIMFNKL